MAIERQAMMDEQAQLSAQYRQLRELHSDLTVQLAECDRQMRQLEGGLALVQRWLRSDNGAGSSGADAPVGSGNGSG